MSIRRWEDFGYGPCNPHPEGEWVRYTDHIAEVERENEAEYASGYDVGFDAGMDKMRAACMKAVERCAWFDSVDTHEDEFLPGSFLDRDDVLAALREVQP